MIIDAHQHLWQIGRNGHSWPTPDLEVIHRDFVPADLLQATADLDITGTVLVQSQPSTIDTAWMLDIAAATPLIKAVVGWTDFLAPDAPDQIATLAAHPKFKGLRPMLQGLDDAWILQDAAAPALAAMTNHGLRFDALVFTRHLPAIDRLAADRPDLPLVIDHGAKPPLATPETLPVWRDAIARLARHPNIACKLSGLLTECGPATNLDAVRACADHLLAIFGPDRLMWGSDWPVVLLKDDYRAWFDWTQAWLADKTESVRDAILGGTATRFYAISET